MKRRDKKDWFIRDAKAEDLEAIRKLYRVVWGHERPLDYDKWKYFNFAMGASQISPVQATPRAKTN